MSESDPQVLCELEDAVAVLTLNRPERMNAWTWRMAGELDAHLKRLDADDAVRAIVVTGKGRGFCAGADLETGEDTFDTSEGAEGDAGSAARDAARGREEAPIEPWEVRKPLIAAINGPAVGVGLTMVLGYDLRIAAEDAKMGFVFVRRGVLPELSSTWILPRLVGIARASDLLMSGRIARGREMAELGVVNEAVPKEQVLPRSMEVARDLATNAAPASVAMTKRLLWRHLAEPDPARAARSEARALGWLGRQPDAKEGVAAFLEKRAPRWQLGPSDAPDPEE